MNSEVDDLSLYFGDDYKVNDYITIHQPTVGEIAMFGEKRYLGLVHTLTCIPSDIMSLLWDGGVDWEEISEYELFYLFISKWISPDDSKILLGDLRLCDFNLFKNANGDVIMKNRDIVIDMNIYRIIVDTVRKIHGLKKKVRKAGNKYTKELMIDVDRNDREEAAKKPFESQLKNLISAMINSSGFKYGLKEVREMPYSAFLDSVNRVLAIKHADTLSIGGVCGMADLSKIPKKEWNYFRTLDE